MIQCQGSGQVCSEGPCMEDPQFPHSAWSRSHPTKKKKIIKKEKEKEKRDFGVFSSVQRGFAVLYSSLFCCWEILAVFTPCQQGFVHIHVPWGLLSASSHTKDAPPVPLQEIHWLWSTIGPHTPNVASALRGRWIFRELTQLA